MDTFRTQILYSSLMPKYNPGRCIPCKLSFIYNVYNLEMCNIKSHNCQKAELQISSHCVSMQYLLLQNCFSMSSNWLFPWILGFQKVMSAKNIVSLQMSASMCMQMCSYWTVTVVSDIPFPALCASKFTKQMYRCYLKLRIKHFEFK